MSVSCSYHDYRVGEAFVGSQHYVVVESIGQLPGVAASGIHIFKSPAIIVSVPYPHESVDFTDSLCILFHEWGHLLDVILKIGDAQDPDELQSKSRAYYDSVISSLPKIGDARVDYELIAWNLGQDGCTIGSKTYKGLKALLDERFETAPRAQILARYELVREMSIKSYRGT